MHKDTEEGILTYIVLKSALHEKDTKIRKEDVMSIQQGFWCLMLFIFGILVGLATMSLFTTSEMVVETIVTEKIVLVDNPIITEKIVTIEIEKPIITQQIVEVLKEVEVYRFIDAGNPVHKWIDPDISIPKDIQDI